MEEPTFEFYNCETYTTAEPGLHDGFEEFIYAWPGAKKYRKWIGGDKYKIRDAWVRQHCSRRIDLIMRILKEDINSDSWKAGFAPNPYKWLNNRLWNREPAVNELQMAEMEREKTRQAVDHKTYDDYRERMLDATGNACTHEQRQRGLKAIAAALAKAGTPKTQPRDRFKKTRNSHERPA